MGNKIYCHPLTIADSKSRFLSLKGKHMGIEELGNGIWKVYYRNVFLGFVCGFTTDHCIKDTMNSLIKKSFKCVLVSDCTATRNKKLQQKIEQEFKVISSKELIKKLTAQ